MFLLERVILGPSAGDQKIKKDSKSKRPRARQSLPAIEPYHLAGLILDPVDKLLIFGIQKRFMGIEDQPRNLDKYDVCKLAAT